MAELVALPGSRPSARRVLVVQRNPFVANSLARYLRRLFAKVSVASSTREAEAVLDDPENTPTDLVCCQRLGPDDYLSSELILRWRSAHPELARVVLATGADEILGDLAGIDAVLLKPAQGAELAALLG